MAVKRYKPTTPARRGMSVQDVTMVTSKERVKSLVKGHRRNSGRNNTGNITVRHRGGGAKRLFRTIDWKRAGEAKAEVIAVVYDPNRTARIAQVRYEDGRDAYILAPDGITVGQTIYQGVDAPINDGNCLPIGKIPSGLFVHNIELHPERGAQMVRSAGMSAVISGAEGKYVYIKLSSGELKKVLAECRATLGKLSNPQHNTMYIGSAGRQRHLGIRPTVRGKAMNTDDHPHGGGEGQNSIGLRRGPKTKWGALALGVKTRSRRKPKLNRVTKR